jgi:hypothetical protein
MPCTRLNVDSQNLTDRWMLFLGGFNGSAVIPLKSIRRPIPHLTKRRVRHTVAAQRHQGENMTEQPTIETATGREIALYIGVHHRTWNRWVQAGTAPQPVISAVNYKAYRITDLDAWGRAMRELGAVTS